MKSSIFQKMTQRIWRISALRVFIVHRAEILQFFRVIFWKIDDFISSFWLHMTFNLRIFLVGTKSSRITQPFLFSLFSNLSNRSNCEFEHVELRKVNSAHLLKKDGNAQKLVFVLLNVPCFQSKNLDRKILKTNYCTLGY